MIENYAIAIAKELMNRCKCNTTVYRVDRLNKKHFIVVVDQAVEIILLTLSRDNKVLLDDGGYAYEFVKNNRNNMKRLYYYKYVSDEEKLARAKEQDDWNKSLIEKYENRCN